MSVIRYDKARRRLWVLNARIHHGMVGLCACVVGVALMLDDWHDRPWLSDNIEC